MMVARNMPNTFSINMLARERAAERGHVSCRIHELRMDLEGRVNVASRRIHFYLGHDWH